MWLEFEFWIEKEGGGVAFIKLSMQPLNHFCCASFIFIPWLPMAICSFKGKARAAKPQDQQYLMVIGWDLVVLVGLVLYKAEIDDEYWENMSMN